MTLLLTLRKRYRLVPTFGRSIIQRFTSNASELSKLAGRDFEDLLQVRCLALGVCFWDWELLYDIVCDSGIRRSFWDKATWRPGGRSFVYFLHLARIRQTTVTYGINTRGTTRDYTVFGSNFAAFREGYVHCISYEGTSNGGGGMDATRGCKGCNGCKG